MCPLIVKIKFTYYLSCLVIICSHLVSQDLPEASLETDFVSNLTFGGEARLRAEAKENYDFNQSSQTYWLQRFRLNADWQFHPEANFFVEAQDSRLFGENEGGVPTVNDSNNPNAFENPLDLRQAYLHANTGNLEVLLGRQNVDVGYGRLFGSNNFRNTSKTFDGGLFKLDLEKDRTLQAFHFAVTPTDPSGFDDFADTGNRYFDSTLTGVIVDDSTLIENVDLKCFWFLRLNPDLDDSVHTVGGVYSRKFGDFKATLESAFQTGEFNGMDHRAWILHAKIMRNFSRIGLVHIAYNYGSGDEDNTDSEHGTFDHLYATNHKFYGIMDLNSLQNHHSVEIVVKRKFQSTTDLTLGYYNFWLDEPETDRWYNVGSTPARILPNDSIHSHLGSELDLQIKHKLNKNFWLDAGICRYFAGDYIDQTGGSNEDPTFFFLSGTYQF